MVGGGQLARMTAVAASRLGLSISVMDPELDCPASSVAQVVIGDPLDVDALVEFGRSVDVVTFDHEGVPVELVEALQAQGVAVAPGAVACWFAFDKAVSRRSLADLGFPIPAFEVVSDAAGIAQFGAEHGWPVVAKAARGGYDGRGVIVVESGEESEAASQLGPVIVVEELVNFDQEIAVMVARRPSGEIVTYPPVSTVQRDGMCAEVTCPAAIAPQVTQAAGQLAIELATVAELVGVMAIELFVVGDQLLVNEMAVRPHNTGHHTIEACVTSQFEQHVRAILDLPLGSTALRAPAAAMYNIIGAADGHDPRNDLSGALGVAGANVHLYGKSARPNRKLGHVTALADSVEQARATAQTAADLLNHSTTTTAMATATTTATAAIGTAAHTPGVPQ